ncbi:MAG: TraR/DksA family transcriptional regulator [Thermoanaerobaculia bacterium]|nr:TraR/DksA family transcriptional regulator [Thermoanaerobaculia bacterium]
MARAKAKPKAWTTHRKLLLQKQQELLEVYDRDRAAAAEQTDDGILDLADKAANSYSRELNFSLSNGERETLMKIDEALGRIDEGEYGHCMNCGQKIGDKRLKAIPWTPFCIDCAELQENGMLDAEE